MCSAGRCDIFRWEEVSLIQLGGVCDSFYCGVIYSDGRGYYSLLRWGVM